MSFECNFCGKICKNLNSQRQHEVRCNRNPDRKDYSKITTYILTHRKGKTKANSEEVARQADILKQMYASGERICHTKGKPGTFTGKHHTKEQIDKMMDSYHNTLKGRKSRYKFGMYKGIYCDSGWELAFLIYNIDKGTQIERNTESFEYMNPLTNKISLYYPDFKIGNVYYEIKGVFDDVVISKHESFPSDKKLVVIGPNEIKMYIDYCTTTYGDNFYSMYDRNVPSFLDKINAEVV